MPNRPSTSLPRAPNGVQFVAVEPAVWDLVMETLEYAQRISVAAPLIMSDTPAGKRISLGAVVTDDSGGNTGRGQKQGMVEIMVTANQKGWAYPFCVETV